MDSQCNDAFALYQRCVPSSVVEYLQKQLRVQVRHSIFTTAVVIWLMILQRLQPKGTLATAVEALLAGAADGLLSGCERARQKRISHRTGGYSHARQRLPKLLCKQVVQELILRLRELLNAGSGVRSYVLDGSSLELESTTALRKAYPPAQNQHGRGHWPVTRIVVLHDLETGLAEEPQWGPMYGPEATSEQRLAEAAMDALTPGAILIADRNFGVFTIAWAAQQRCLGTVVRLTAERARKLLGRSISAPGAWPVCWMASRSDGKRRGGMPPEASVQGRLVAARVGRGKSKQWLLLFTTTSLPMEQLVELYQKRWRIETDLRSLKRTVHLQHVTARQPSMMEKEILTAIAAYNLVRAIMALAAARHQLSPRQLSFTFALNVVNAAWQRLQSAPDELSYQREVFRLLDAVAQGKHPRRRKRRSYPRTVWPHGGTFPHPKTSQ
jgi:hypothetical protein